MSRLMNEICVLLGLLTAALGLAPPVMLPPAPAVLPASLPASRVSLPFQGVSVVDAAAPVVHETGRLRDHQFVPTQAKGYISEHAEANLLNALGSTSSQSAAMSKDASSLRPPMAAKADPFVLDSSKPSKGWSRVKGIALLFAAVTAAALAAVASKRRSLSGLPMASSNAAPATVTLEMNTLVRAVSGQAVFAPQKFAVAAVTGEVKTSTRNPVTGMPIGPWPVGVTTIQLDDHSRKDPESGGPRRLQTEIWYPAGDESIGMPKNLYSEFLGRGVISGSIKAAEEPDAIGGYLPGLTIKKLDATWPNSAVRDARPRPMELSEEDGGGPWPLVVFSHGSGAFRGSYIYFTEFLASHGFIVVACDHLGSSRYTQVDGEVITPGGARSKRHQMETDRPLDMLFLIDSMSRLNQGADSRFTGRIDIANCAVTGMSFGGWAAAAVLEKQDPRVKAAICKCPSLKSAGGNLAAGGRRNRVTPVMAMIGVEDTVIGAEGNELCRQYFATHEGPRFLVEIKAGGHVSFTSCELYNPNYGNGIGESKSLSNPGSTYTPLPPDEQHAIVNTYALAFLDAYLRPSSPTAAESLKILEANNFADKIAYSSAL